VTQRALQFTVGDDVASKHVAVSPYASPGIQASDYVVYMRAPSDDDSLRRPLLQ